MAGPQRSLVGVYVKIFRWLKKPWFRYKTGAAMIEGSCNRKGELILSVQIDETFVSLVIDEDSAYKLRSWFLKAYPEGVDSEQYTGLETSFSPFKTKRFQTIEKKTW